MTKQQCSSVSFSTVHPSHLQVLFDENQPCFSAMMTDCHGSENNWWLTSGFPVTDSLWRKLPCLLHAPSFPLGLNSSLSGQGPLLTGSPEWHTHTPWVTAFKLKHYLNQVVNWLNSFGHSLGFWTGIIAFVHTWANCAHFTSLSSCSLDLEPAAM